MHRRVFIRTAAGVGASLIPACGQALPNVEEMPLTAIRDALHSGKTTSLQLVDAYLSRIEQLDSGGPTLRSVIEQNPDARGIAASLDDELKHRGPRGPLHGVPILIKDNIATHDSMGTTAGSLVLAVSTPPRDAFVVQRLRAAGAIIIGKTNLSEWANFRGMHSTSGWSARGGQTRNPYALDRNPSGSSSGSAVAVAASLCGAAIGTETDGSIISPSAMCGIVGLKPTVGLISRNGIIPISHTQDTAGPMARSVTDAATLLSAMTGEDAFDGATSGSQSHVAPDYTAFLDSNGLKNVRIGIARESFDSNTALSAIIGPMLTAMSKRGAILIDVSLPSRKELGAAEIIVFHHEFKAGLNKYLSALSNSAVADLNDVIKINERLHDQELALFGQEHLIAAQAAGHLYAPEYLAALDHCRQWSRTNGLDAIMDEHQLDAIFVSTGGPAGIIDYRHGDQDTGGGATSIAAIAGYPSIALPAGYFGELPVGIALMGRAWSEPTLIKLAYAIEQLKRVRVAPRFLATSTTAM